MTAVPSLSSCKSQQIPMPRSSKGFLRRIAGGADNVQTISLPDDAAAPPPPPPPPPPLAPLLPPPPSVSSLKLCSIGNDCELALLPARNPKAIDTEVLPPTLDAGGSADATSTFHVGILPCTFPICCPPRSSPHHWCLPWPLKPPPLLPHPLLRPPPRPRPAPCSRRGSG